MTALTNPIQNNMLEAAAQHAPRHVVHAIQNASSKSGVDFAYLMKQAKLESSFDPEAKATTSSASGLYQFIESTWMSMVDSYGDEIGIDLETTDKKALLEKRNDPKIASFMAAKLAGDNQRVLQNNWDNTGERIGDTELYLAHFLGAGSAAAFMNAKDDNPLQDAAVLFPKAAQANKAVFYDSTTGKSRSLSEVYSFFEGKMERAVPNLEMTGNSTVTTPKATNAASVKTTAATRPASYARDLMLTPIEVLMMTQHFDLPFLEDRQDKRGYF